MKTNLLCTSIVAVLAATAAFAQNSTQKATVPFAFIAGNQALPAGQYTVDRGPVAGVVMIRSADGKGATMILTHAVYSAVARHANHSARNVTLK